MWDAEGVLWVVVIGPLPGAMVQASIVTMFSVIIFSPGTQHIMLKQKRRKVRIGKVTSLRCRGALRVCTYRHNYAFLTPPQGGNGHVVCVPVRPRPAQLRELCTDEQCPLRNRAIVSCGLSACLLARLWVRASDAALVFSSEMTLPTPPCRVYKSTS